MKTKHVQLLLLSYLLIQLGNAQNIRLALDVSPSTVFARVNDKDDRPSSQSVAADGFTEAEGAEQGMNFTLSAILPLNEKWGFQLGFGVSNKKLHIRNTDANYTGVSRYSVDYLHMPFLFRFHTEEFKKVEKLRAFGAFGLALEVKAKENVLGGDGAHFWNMAKQRTWADPYRGRNAKNKPVALFSPLDMGLVLRGGLEYEVFDDFHAHLSLTYQHNFINMIHPNLRFANAERDRVADNLSIRTSLLLVDLGCSYRF